MLPNLRSMIVAIIASILGISCGLGLFAMFRVNRDPILRVPSAAQSLLGFSTPESKVISTSSVKNAAVTFFDNRFTSALSPPTGRSVVASAPAPTARADPVGASPPEANTIIGAAERPETRITEADHPPNLTKADAAYSADTVAEIANAELTSAEAAKAEVANTDESKAEAANVDATKAEMTTKAEARLDVTNNEATKTEISVDVSNTESTKTVAKADVTNRDAAKAEASKAEVANSEVMNAEAKADFTNTELTTAEASKSAVVNTDTAKAETTNVDVISAEVTKAEAGKPDVANADVTKPEANLNVTNGESIKAAATKLEFVTELTSGDRKTPAPKPESVVETSAAEQSLATSVTGQKTVRRTNAKVHAKTADAKVRAKKTNTPKVHAKTARARPTHPTVKSQQAAAQQLTGFGQFGDQGFAAQSIYQYSQTQVVKPVRIRRTSRHHSSS
jgi:hypothetical protein